MSDNIDFKVGNKLCNKRGKKRLRGDLRIEGKKLRIVTE